ncbi:hypothetical protein CFC21_101666 [Triticum aestivum]|uniref:Subtilisin inhibitor 1 n=7 Tax=Triticinae TaxID=1648030 RepID=A0A341Z6A9_WHEAT|nr:Subtilisin inhibitor 1 [Triticum urartu]KAF7100118.1 hypothetical protein CFC21_101666 [Triticum aestivum]VAI84029.1 unnamed protein product [Triticum turgidum subsp. durum]
MAGADPTRTSWPEVVGIPATPAVMKINHDRSDVAIEVLPDGVKVPKGFNAKRVRVFFDAKESQGLVVRTPVVG